jgi:hypothetical protein
MALLCKAASMKRFAVLLLTGLLAQSASADGRESRWGALAFGGNSFGATRGRLDESSAVQGALRQCAEGGGGNQCEIRITYRDRCIAYASGDNRETGLGYSEELEDAIFLAKQICARVTTNCQIQYAACSLPSSFN